MKNQFFKFPSTPHLAMLPGVQVRNDKVFSEVERRNFLSHEILVEEKVDGANLGISFDDDGNIQAQNRGNHLQLPAFGQWKRLEQWITPRIDILFNGLFNRYILFGEWCFAKHSVFYDRLPDWFLGFDINDRQTGKFVSIKQRNFIFNNIGIIPVPFIAQGHFTCSELKSLLSTSKLCDQPAEGLYLRYDQEDWLKQRAKLVRPSFIQTIVQHWAGSFIIPNQLRPVTKQ